MARTNMNELNKKLDNILEVLGNMDERVKKLENVKESKKTTASKSSTTKKSSAKTSSRKGTATVEKSTKVAEPKSIKGMKIADFEPRKYDGFYRWGMKSDGFNQKSYMGMRKAYCVYKATNGEHLDPKKAYEAGVRIDYSEGGAYAKAKAEFEKKFKYVKKGDR